MSLKNKVKMYLKGFTSDDYVNYNFARNDPKDYITESERWKSRNINGKYNIVLDDKRLFYETFCRHLNIPRTLLFVSDGNIFDYETHRILNTEEVVNVLKEYKGLVFRPLSSGGGKDINIITFINDKFFLNHICQTEENIKDFLKVQYNCVVSEYLFQHKYSSDIYDKSVNTIRIITIQEENKGAIIPLALHRFGTDDSYPVDNACSGGIFAPIYVETGVIGKAKSYRNNHTVVLHPNTNTRIEGVIVPKWDYIKESIISVANKFPYINFFAWDVVITNDGFSVIESNISTDIAFFQMYNPERNGILGNFYRKKGVIK